MLVNDYWIDSDDNHLYRWNGSSWEDAQDDDIAQTILDVADAQATADGKIKTFAQPSAPTAEGIGDIWMDTDDNNRLYRWNGSSWVDYVQDEIGRNHAVATGNPHSATLSDITALMSASGSTVIAGVGNDFIMEAGSSSVTFRHNLASLSTVGAYSGTLRTGLFQSANGIVMGYNRKSDGVWVDTIVLDGTTGTSIYGGDVITSGRVVASGLYTEGGSGEAGAIVGTVTGAGNIGVIGASESGIGVFGFAPTGVWGYGQPGVLAQGVLPASLGGIGLSVVGRMNIDNSYQVTNLNASYLGGYAASDFSLASHNHSGVYSVVGHNHDGSYAAFTHTHTLSGINDSIAFRKIQVSYDGSSVADSLYLRIYSW